MEVLVVVEEAAAVAAAAENAEAHGRRAGERTTAEI